VSSVLDTQIGWVKVMDTSQGSENYRAELRATGGLAIWTFAWLATLALARFGPLLWWETLPAATWASIILNIIVGVVWVVAFTRYLRALDELQRKIVQDALAVALGVGWVAGFGYVVAEKANVLPVDVEFAVLPALMGIVFIVAVFGGRLKYR
jgi:hypothetical protein